MWQRIKYIIFGIIHLLFALINIAIYAVGIWCIIETVVPFFKEEGTAAFKDGGMWINLIISLAVCGLRTTIRIVKSFLSNVDSDAEVSSNPTSFSVSGNEIIPHYSSNVSIFEYIIAIVLGVLCGALIGIVATPVIVILDIHYAILNFRGEDMNLDVIEDLDDSEKK